jgi:hypothetical protein
VTRFLRRNFTPERIVLFVLLFVGGSLAQGHGWRGFAILMAAAVMIGGVIGLIGRRYPMIWSQNRRDRRRRRRNSN